MSESGDDAVSANPTRSGRIPKVKAKVAGASAESLTEVSEQGIHLPSRKFYIQEKKQCGQKIKYVIGFFPTAANGYRSYRW